MHYDSKCAIIIEIMSLVTIDTNVFFMALYSSKGASYQILKLVRDGLVTMALSVPVYAEYQDVLQRYDKLEQLELTKHDISAFLAAVAVLSKQIDIRFSMRPHLRDEADNIFVELAFASQSEYLITANVKDFTFGNDLLVDSFSVITPTDFMKQWRKNHG